jgi:trigger factor
VPVLNRNVLEEGDVASLEISTRVEDGEFSMAETVTHSIGSGTLSEQLEDELIGLEVDGERDVCFVADDDHPVSSLRGKEVAYKVKLRSISANEEVELTDEVAKEIKSLPQSFESISELRAFIKDKKVKQSEEAGSNAAFTKVAEVILERNPFRVPKGQIDNEVRQMLAGIGLRIPDDKWYSSQGDQYRQWLRPSAEKSVKMFYLVDAIIRQEDIAISEEEIEKEFKELVESYGKQVEEIDDKEVVESLKSEIKHKLASGRVMDMLIAKNNITYVPPKPKEVDAPAKDG